MTTTGAEADRDGLWAYGYTFREIEAMDRFAAFEAGALAGASRAREDLRGWVLLVGDPRGGFDIVGPFPDREAAEARASRWECADSWPMELQHGAPGARDEPVRD